MPFEGHIEVIDGIMNVGDDGLYNRIESVNVSPIYAILQGNGQVIRDVAGGQEEMVSMSCRGIKESVIRE